MGKILTEEMVVARTKISDLSKVKRLNCWGSELSDVTLLRNMPLVEVLSLSINKISSLADFQFCKRLEELYIRQNDIADINQVVYLQNLPNLRNLWMGENPCAQVDGYRLSVIKTLPQIQKLDNIPVSAEELREAQKKGRSLTDPREAQESEEEEEVYVPPPANRYQEYSESEYSPPQRISPRQEPEYEIYENRECYREENSEIPREYSKEYNSPRQSPPRTNTRSYSPDEGMERRSYERESPKQHYYSNKLSPNSSSFEGNILPLENGQKDGQRMYHSQSANCIKEYMNGDRLNQAADKKLRQTESSESQISAGRERYVCSASHRPPFNRRPVTRNSNILSAALCLVKELDYPSLEVVEMAVRCRMDELDQLGE